MITDYWAGLEEFFTPGLEIVVSRSARETLSVVRSLSDQRRYEIGMRARSRALLEHTAAHRAEQLETYLVQALEQARVP